MCAHVEKNITTILYTCKPTYLPKATPGTNPPLPGHHHHSRNRQEHHSHTPHPTPTGGAEEGAGMCAGAHGHVGEQQYGQSHQWWEDEGWSSEGGWVVVLVHKEVQYLKWEITYWTILRISLFVSKKNKHSILILLNLQWHFKALIACSLVKYLRVAIHLRKVGRYRISPPYLNR